MRHSAAANLDSSRKAVLVLGMHRSGTSALAGVINALGVATPKTLVASDQWNERGYFESLLLYSVLDELLEAAGSKWDDWEQLDLHWLRSPSAEQYRQKIKSVLLEEYADTSLFVIKDPRICRLIPFMTSILADLSADPVAALSVRNPLEVAYSLARRDQFPISKSLRLWLRHMLDAELYSRQMPRAFFLYEDFIADWRQYVVRFYQATGIAKPDHLDSLNGRIDDFLASELRHEKASSDELNHYPEVVPLVRQTYGVLSELAKNGESGKLLGQLDQIRGLFDESCFNPADGARKLA
jgi:hypothetical protein